MTVVIDVSLVAALRAAGCSKSRAQHKARDPESAHRWIEKRGVQPKDEAKQERRSGRNTRRRSRRRQK